MSARALKWGFGVLREVPLNASERLVLLALCFHHHPDSDACFPSLDTIGAYAGLSERPTRNTLRSLEGKGLISTLKRSIGGRQRSNQYDLFGDPRGAAGSPPKPQSRGAKKSRPQQATRGGPLAAPDRGDRYSREKPSQVRLTHPQFETRGEHDA